MPKQSDSSVEAMAQELMSLFDLLAQEFLLPQQSAHFSRTEAALLRLLGGQEGTKMSEVSAGLGLALSSSTGVVDRLVERGLVARTRPETDRRCVRVALTARGRSALEGLERDRARLGVAVLERLPARERHTLLEIFRKVARREG